MNSGSSSRRCCLRPSPAAGPVALTSVRSLTASSTSSAVAYPGGCCRMTCPPLGHGPLLLPAVAAGRHLGEDPHGVAGPPETRRWPQEESLGRDRRHPDGSYCLGRRKGVRRWQADSQKEATHHRGHDGVAPGGGGPLGQSQDRDGVKRVGEGVKGRFPRLKLIWA